MQNAPVNACEVPPLKPLGATLTRIQEPGPWSQAWPSCPTPAECLLVADDDKPPLGAREQHVHPPRVVEEADRARVVGPNRRHADHLALHALRHPPSSSPPSIAAPSLMGHAYIGAVSRSLEQQAGPSIDAKQAP